MLGSIYENGEEGVNQDFKEALKWYQKASLQGDNKALVAKDRLKKKMDMN